MAAQPTTAQRVAGSTSETTHLYVSKRIHDSLSRVIYFFKYIYILFLLNHMKTFFKFQNRTVQCPSVSLLVKVTE